MKLKIFKPVTVIDGFAGNCRGWLGAGYHNSAG